MGFFCLIKNKQNKFLDAYMADSIDQSNLETRQEKIFENPFKYLWSVYFHNFQLFPIVLFSLIFVLVTEW